MFGGSRNKLNLKISLMNWLKMEKIKATQRMHLWLDIEGDMFMGLGRVQLLERIDRYGSLNKAAASMGMSYRAAWGRMKKTEAMLGKALVEKTGPRKEFRLTDFGYVVIRNFRRWQKDVERYALKRSQRIFSWTIIPFESNDSPQDDDIIAPEENGK